MTTGVNSTQERRFLNAVKAGDIPTVGRLLDLYPEYRDLFIGRKDLLSYCTSGYDISDNRRGRLIKMAVFLTERGFKVTSVNLLRFFVLGVWEYHTLLERLLNVLQKQQVDLNSVDIFDAVLRYASPLTVNQIRLLQRYNVDVNRRDFYGKTPLYRCFLQHGNLSNKLAINLMECGADVNVKCLAYSVIDYVRAYYPSRSHTILDLHSTLRRQLLPFIVAVLNVHELPELVISFL